MQCKNAFIPSKGKGIEQKKRPSRDQSGKLQFHIWRHSSGWWRTEGDKITVGVDTHLLRDDVDNNNSTQVGMWFWSLVGAESILFYWQSSRVTITAQLLSQNGILISKGSRVTPILSRSHSTWTILLWSPNNNNPGLLHFLFNHSFYTTYTPFITSSNSNLVGVS